ncbi:MAG: hypothetical protein K2I20_00520 [Clostridia bacterium]|nr:hypothetical protein [Clostridia bacterium]MDE7214633.1 hypothetical protein [Clostridia bacterium]
MEHKCGKCEYYNALYLKVYCGFLNSDYGYCHILQCAKNKNDCCKHWTKQIPEVFDGKKYKKVFESTLTQLNGITIILNELTEQLNSEKE